MKVLITGASGYLGSMITYFLYQEPEIEKIYALDIQKPKILWQPNEKIIFIQKNLVDDWEKDIDEVDVIFHFAFWIRRPFWWFQLKKHLYENSFGLEKVLNFAQIKKVKKIIALSSIAVYGANKENNHQVPFKEDSALKEKEYLYGKEKIEMEKKLKDFSEKNKEIKVIVLRLATVTGPFAQKYFKKGGLLKFMKNFAPFIVLASNNSLRQYVHEDDVCQSILLWLKTETENNFEVFNIAPPSFVYFRDLAKILGKKTVKVPYWFLKISFSLCWLLSLGKIPTAPGSVNSYSFPIVVDGSKITNYGFSYKYSALDAFLGEKGYFQNLFSPNS